MCAREGDGAGVGSREEELRRELWGVLVRGGK